MSTAWPRRIHARSSRRAFLAVGIIALCAALVACTMPGASPTPPPATVTVAPTPTPPPTSTPTPRPTLTPRPTTPATPTLEAGWQLYELPAEGFALGLPAGWLTADRDPRPPATGVENLLELYPELDFLFGVALTESSFAACDPGPSAVQGSLGPCMLVFHGRPPAPPSLDQFVADFLENLDRVPTILAGPDTRPVDLQAGQAVEIRYTAGLTMPDASAATISYLTYLIVSDGELGILTFVVAANQFSEHAPQLQKIAGAFRWTAPEAGGQREAFLLRCPTQ